METKIIFDFGFSVFDWFCIIIIAAIATEWGRRR